MKKRKEDEDSFTAFINTLRNKFPPTSEKNKRAAYKEYLSFFNARREVMPALQQLFEHKPIQLEVRIFYEQWEAFYKPNRSAAEIAEDLRNARQLKASGFGLDTDMGRGGRRGISREWKLYINAEKILFNTEEILKKFDLTFENSYDFSFLIRRHAMGELPPEVDEMTRKALTYCVTVLGSVIVNFVDAYKPRYRKHRTAVEILFEGDFPTASNGTDAGRKVTKKSIYRAVSKIRDHMSGEERLRDEKFYTDKKFYYLAWLARQCEVYVNIMQLPVSEKKQAKEDIKKILRHLPASERPEIIRESVEELNFSEKMDKVLTDIFNNRVKKPS